MFNSMKKRGEENKAEYLKGAHALYHFAEVIENDQIPFDYKLKS